MPSHLQQPTPLSYQRSPPNTATAHPAIQIENLTKALNAQLVSAAVSGDTYMVDQLLTEGASVEAVGDSLSDYNCRALHHAVIGGHTDVVGLLISEGAAFYPSDLHNAIELGHIGVVELLLNRGASVESPPLSYQPSPPNTATALPTYSNSNSNYIAGHIQIENLTKALNAKLLSAAVSGDTYMVDQLLTEGASVEAVGDSLSDYNCRALHHAVIGGHTDVVGLLISKGAAFYPSDLHNAIELGHIGVVELLLHRGASVESPPLSYQPSPPTLATKYSHRSPDIF